MPATQRLTRSRNNRIIAGVCGGLAEYFRLDSTLVRIVMVILGLFWGGGVVLYLALWVIVPLAGEKEARPELGARVRQAADEAKATVKKVRDEFRKP